MDVYWLEQNQADVPQGNDWLGPNEVTTLRTMRFPKRRADWLLGRWTGKNAFANCFGHSLDFRTLRDIEIRAALSGAPEIFFRGDRSMVTISLSHRGGIGACALAPSPVLLGCDIEIIESHGDAFATDYFTLEEQASFAKTDTSDRLRLAALFWSGKESALKALGEGLRLDTRSVVVSLPFRLENTQEKKGSPLRIPPSSFSSSLSPQNGWNPIEVRNRNGRILHGWWGQSGSLVRTVLSAPPTDAPILLAQEHCFA